jgi:hypothetical protein
MYFIQHCFFCRLSDSTVSEDAGIEPRTVAYCTSSYFYVSVLFKYLHVVVDLDGVCQVLEAGRDLGNALLKVEDVHGELVRLGTGRTEQLSRVLHERLVGLQQKLTLSYSRCLK